MDMFVDNVVQETISAFFLDFSLFFIIKLKVLFVDFGGRNFSLEILDEDLIPLRVLDAESEEEGHLCRAGFQGHIPGEQDSEAFKDFSRFIDGANI